MVTDDTLPDVAASEAKTMKIVRYTAVGSALFILAALGLQVLA